MSATENLAAQLKKRFAFEATSGQNAVFELIDAFIADKQNEYPIFILRGYAGTGKTTIVSALVKTISRFGYRPQMLAPTGRAAKVMSSYAGRPAYTIHRMIYQATTDSQTGSMKFKRQKNVNRNTLFLIDEASMLGTSSDFGGAGLLADLIEYIFEDSSNKLMLIGDVAQLPPVGQNSSPALDGDYLSRTFGVEVIEVELTEVVRQQQDSGILANATMLRRVLNENPPYQIEFFTKTYKDIFRMDGRRLEEGLNYAYSKYGEENVALITRSNKSAVAFNNLVRLRIKQMENQIDAGDLVMIARNNYTWLDEGAPAGFLANGDFAQVLSVRNQEEIYGHTFADLRLRLLDYPDEQPVEAKVILDTLNLPAPNLGKDALRLLYEKAMEPYNDEPSRTLRKEAVRNDPYINALQIKFAYALTCHKSQGGQWPAVFVDQGYLPPNTALDQETIRWLYTGITRASQELFLVNFDDQFFGNQPLEW